MLKPTKMNGIRKILVLIAKEKFNFLKVFWVHLNLNVLFCGALDDIPNTFVIFNGSDTEKAIG